MTAKGPLSAEADVLVIGGGIMGLSIAYGLARAGHSRIVVVDKTYLCGGASGRNGGGVRAQWSSDTNVRLMKRSIEICESFATEMRINVWFRQGGYLFLAHSPERAADLEKSAALQKSHGLKTEMISPAAAKEIVPWLDTSTLSGASYNPDDGVVFPWPFVWGYARACEERGVELHTFTEVENLLVEGGRVVGAQTNRGTIRAPLVILATGAWSPEVTRTAGFELPTHPHRHEICSTEPLKPFLKPLVADLATGLYFSQSMRGEIVGGISNENVPPGVNQESGAEFLNLYASALTKLAPIFSKLRVLRQWAGCYDLTEDGSPVVGFVDELPGLFLTSGFMGHGFMMAPVMGELVARYLSHNEEAELFRKWNVRRFKTGELVRETMILG